jgi:IS30 family transposase
VSATEARILAGLLGQGMTTRQAADEMGRSHRTVMNLMKRHKLRSKHLRFGERYTDASGAEWTTAKGKIVRARRRG